MSDATPDPEFVLRGVAGTAFGRAYRLLAPTTVGRSPECDICLDHPGVSRLHARLRPREYGVEIEDLRSTNGSFLNGQRVTAGIARAGDEIAFDTLRFRVHSAGRAPGAPARSPAPMRPGRSRAWWVGAAAAVAGLLAWFATRQ